MPLKPEGLTFLSFLMSTVSLAQTMWIVWIRLPRIAVKVEATWDFLIRRAISEAVNKGVATMKSPIAITDTALAWVPPDLVADLREFYRTTGHLMPRVTLFAEIERRFGDRINAEVCIPHNLYAGACMLIVEAIAKKGMEA